MCVCGGGGGVRNKYLPSQQHFRHNIAIQTSKLLQRANCNTEPTNTPAAQLKAVQVICSDRTSYKIAIIDENSLYLTQEV